MSIGALISATLFGLCCLLFARQILGFFLRGMAWQQRNIGAGGTVPFQIRVLQSRFTLWFLRLLGALMLLGAAIAGVEALKGGRS